MTLKEFGQGRSLRALVDTERGANIASLRTADGFEILAAGTAPDPQPDNRDFSRGGLRGYDDCFPTIAGGDVAAFGRHPLSDHGDVWYRPWHTVADRSTDATVRFEARCSLDTFGLRISRVVELDELGARFTVQLSNETEQRVPFMWAGHLLLAIESGDRLELGDLTMVIETNNLNVAHRARARLDEIWPRDDDQEFAWDDLAAGAFAKSFTPWPAEGVTVHRRDHVIHVESTGPNRADHLGLWINSGGFPDHGPQAHIGIEPTLGEGDSLAEALSTSTNLWLEPYETREVDFSISVLPRA